MSTYIIGEIGQNHNGSVSLAQKLIDIAAIPIIDEFSNEDLKPLDAIKLTKRDLSYELTASQMKQAYNSPHSFGSTYGAHREALELSDEEHAELYTYAKAKGLEFVETLCAPTCLSMLKLFTPDKLKVASRDLTNLPLLEAMAETKIPIILSTGMGGIKELDDALASISKYHSNISILHCISEYPAQYKNINLHTLNYLEDHYSEYVIGYSDHSIGIMIPVAAVAMGAKIIEKHITLDRGMKGSDHAGSLEPNGLWRMVRDIRNLESSFGEKHMFISDAVDSAKYKLERSIASAIPIKAGEIITQEMLTLLSPGDGFKWRDKNLVIGKKAMQNIDKHELIYFDLIQ